MLYFPTPERQCSCCKQYLPATTEFFAVASKAHARLRGDGGCNNSKRNQDAEQWLIERFGERKARQILARIQQYFDSLK